jgi:hypothetical protein
MVSGSGAKVLLAGDSEVEFVVASQSLESCKDV